MSTEFEEKPSDKILAKEICFTCGKRIPQKEGSFTSWIFGENRCKCGTPGAWQRSGSKLTQQHISQEIKQVPVSIDLGERYQVQTEIGRGGMGTVYKVWDLVNRRIVAVKVMHPDLATDETAVKRFEHEARAAGQLTHANIVSVFGMDRTRENRPYLIMDYCDGDTLSTLLALHEKLDPERALHIFVQLCDAIAHAHAKGIVHRDIKPGNVLITKDQGGADVVHLVDFGIAKNFVVTRETQNLTTEGEVFGSTQYMSPEQCLGLTIDVRSDLYSLGCLMYEVLTGYPPFNGENPVQVIAAHLNEEIEISPELGVFGPVIRHCLRKEPSLRYATAQELLSDLLSLQSGGKKIADSRQMYELHVLYMPATPLFFVSCMVGNLFAVDQWDLFFGLGVGIWFFSILWVQMYSARLRVNRLNKELLRKEYLAATQVGLWILLFLIVLGARFWPDKAEDFPIYFGYFCQVFVGMLLNLLLASGAVRNADRRYREKTLLTPFDVWSKNLDKKMFPSAYDKKASG
jgi:tRNA A-37 threonylcarbamoyl transferase component Bud32